jgi:hypothetical protein
MNQTAEEATENVLTQQIPEVMRLQEMGELHVDSNFFFSNFRKLFRYYKSKNSTAWY